MENLFSDLFENKKFTKTQKRIAAYFIKNQFSVANSSLADISAAIGVSDISVLRFVRLLGFSGYTDFKDKIQAQIATALQGSLNSYSLQERLDANHPTSSDLRFSFSELMHKNLEDSLCQNSNEAFTQAAEMITNAKHRYILGLRSCRGIALCFTRLLKYMHDDVYELNNTDNDVFFQMQSMEPGDAVVIFCAPRYYKQDLLICQNIKKIGGKICLIADSIFSPLAAEADVVLSTACNSFSFFNSMVGYDAIAEYLLTQIGMQNDAFIHDRLNSLDRIVKEQLY